MIHECCCEGFNSQKYISIHLIFRGVKLLTSVDISTRAPWIMQNEQHFVAGEIPHELDAQMEGH
jgi:hypothetical protein